MGKALFVDTAFPLTTARDQALVAIPRHTFGSLLRCYLIAHLLPQVCPKSCAICCNTVPCRQSYPPLRYARKSRGEFVGLRPFQDFCLHIQVWEGMNHFDFLTAKTNPRRLLAGKPTSD